MRKLKRVSKRRLVSAVVLLAYCVAYFAVETLFPEFRSSNSVWFFMGFIVLVHWVMVDSVEELLRVIEASGMRETMKKPLREIIPILFWLGVVALWASLFLYSGKSIIETTWVLGTLLLISSFFSYGGVPYFRQKLKGVPEEIYIYIKGLHVGRNGMRKNEDN